MRAQDLINCFDDEQLAQFMALVACTGQDQVIPFTVYRQMVTYCEEHDIEAPTMFVDVEAADVEKRFQKQGVGSWVSTECGGINFEEA
jgi:hypothetical protein